MTSKILERFALEGSGGVNTCYVIIAVTQQIRRTLSRQVKYTKFDNPLAHINNCVRLNIPKRLHNLSQQHAFWVSHYRKVPHRDISRYCWGFCLLRQELFMLACTIKDTTCATQFNLPGAPKLLIPPLRTDKKWKCMLWCARMWDTNKYATGSFWWPAHGRKSWF